MTAEHDVVVPATHALKYLRAFGADGDRVRRTDVRGAGHFELVAPGSVAFPSVLFELDLLLSPRAAS